MKSNVPPVIEPSVPETVIPLIVPPLIVFRVEPDAIFIPAFAPVEENTPPETVPTVPPLLRNRPLPDEPPVNVPPVIEVITPLSDT